MPKVALRCEMVKADIRRERKSFDNDLKNPDSNSLNANQIWCFRLCCCGRIVLRRSIHLKINKILESSEVGKNLPKFFALFLIFGAFFKIV